MFVHPVQAHSDTPIILKEGVLKGLPKEFRPAGFDTKKKILTIKGQELEMPKVLMKVFTDEVLEMALDKKLVGDGIPHGLQFSSSWYHGPSDLPAYLVIKVSPEKRRFRYEIMVDLEAVTVRKAKVILLDDRGEWHASFPIDLSKEEGHEPEKTEWKDVIGKWRGEGVTVEFTKDRIIFDEIWSDEDKVWKVLDSKKLNSTEVLRDDKSEDSLVYERDGDLLSFGTARGWFGTVAKFGSKADLDAQRRHENQGEDER